MGVGTSRIKKKTPMLEDVHGSTGTGTGGKKQNGSNCFGLFCPPLAARDTDPLGSPLPPTPRLGGNGNGAAGRGPAGRRSSKYNGLEVERGSFRAHTLNGIGGVADGLFASNSAEKHNQGESNKRGYGNDNGTQNTNYYGYENGNGNGGNPSSDTPFIYNGPDGEQRFMKKYQMCEVLGVGSTSICHRCVDRKTGKSYACKIIDKVQIEERFEGMIEQFHTEILALQKLSKHPNIIKLYDVYTTSSKIYIVMELMAGGELFDYVVKKGALTESEASAIVRMVTSALVYMHDQNIIHRDLKPENLLLTKNPHSIYDIEVKIIDFGLSKSIMSEPLAKSFLGTRGYLAPEMLQRRDYSKAVDTWALGVIVFVLLCGCLPFDDDSSSIPSDDLVRSKFTLRFPRWARNLSPSAKDLLSRLLDVDPMSRYTAVDAMNHPWVRGQTAPKDSMLHSPGKISLTPSKNNGKMRGGDRSGGGVGSGNHQGQRMRTSTEGRAAANRSQMNQMIANRARANSLPRQYRPLVRKKSI